jgi:hypothetical protein
MDLGGKDAARATHATGSPVFFGRWRHADEHGSMTSRSSARHRRKHLIPLQEYAPNGQPCASS